MTKQEHIQYWINTSLHDLESAEDIFNAGRYDWALFIGHLVLEKILKALWVKNNESNFPPKIHNLLKLAEVSSANLSEQDLLFLNRANGFNLETRYPEYKSNFFEQCTKEFAEQSLQGIKEIHKCIQEQI